ILVDGNDRIEIMVVQEAIGPGNGAIPPTAGASVGEGTFDGGGTVDADTKIGKCSGEFLVVGDQGDGLVFVFIELLVDKRMNFVSILAAHIDAGNGDSTVGLAGVGDAVNRH